MKAEGHSVYELSDSSCPIKNIHDAVEALAHTNDYRATNKRWPYRRLYVFDNNISFGELVEDIKEQQDRHKIRDNLTTEEVLQSPEYRFIPRLLWERILSEPPQKLEDTSESRWGISGPVNPEAVPVRFGLRMKDIEYLEVTCPQLNRGETGPFIVHTLHQPERRFCLGIHREIGDVNYMVYDSQAATLDQHLQDNDEEKVLSGTGQVHWFIHPVPESAVKVQAVSVLAETDDLHLPRAQGTSTIQALSSMLSKKLGRKIGNTDECAQELAKIAEEIEDDFIEALGLPKIILLTHVEDEKFQLRNAFNHAKKVTELPQVVALFSEMDGESSAEVWARQVICRALIILHTRGTRLVEANYRTTMYPLKDLIRAVLETRGTDPSEYLRDQILVGNLSFHRTTEPTDVSKEASVVVEQAIEELPDVVF